MTNSTSPTTKQQQRCRRKGQLATGTCPHHTVGDSNLCGLADDEVCDSQYTTQVPATAQLPAEEAFRTGYDLVTEFNEAVDRYELNQHQVIGIKPSPDSAIYMAPDIWLVALEAQQPDPDKGQMAVAYNTTVLLQYKSTLVGSSLIEQAWLVYEECPSGFDTWCLHKMPTAPAKNKPFLLVDYCMTSEQICQQIDEGIDTIYAGALTAKPTD